MRKVLDTLAKVHVGGKRWAVAMVVVAALGIIGLVPSGQSLAQTGGWWPGLAQTKLVKDEKLPEGRNVLFHVMENGRAMWSVSASESKDPSGKLILTYLFGGKTGRFPTDGKGGCPDMRVPLTELAAHFGRKPAVAVLPCRHERYGDGVALRGSFPVTGSGVTPAKAGVAKGPAAAATTAAATGPTCTKDDIEGNWRRSDGATVTLIGVQIFGGSGSGGVALLFNHPAGWWPKGHHKFTKIYRTGGPRSCKMTAMCANYDRMASGQIKRNERPCVLEVDPKARTMTESGTRLTYSRP